MASIAVPNLVIKIFDMIKISAVFKIGDYRLTALETIHPDILFSGQLIHRAVVVHDVDLFKIVALAHKEVVRIVCRSDFNYAGAEFTVDIIICDNGNFTPSKRQINRLSDEMRVTFILRIYGNGGISGKRQQFSEFGSGLLQSFRAVIYG